jgi:CBS domain-containing protein
MGKCHATGIHRPGVAEFAATRSGLEAIANSGTIGRRRPGRRWHAACFGKGMKVRDLMTPAPQTITATETLAVARERMEQGRFRRLPVVDAEGRLIGMLTDRDVREHAGHLHDTRVTGAMVEPAKTVDIDDPVDGVAERLVHERIGGFPVVDRSGALVGVITETDVLRGMVLASRGGATLDVLCVVPPQSLTELLGVVERAGGSVVALHRETRHEGVRAYRLRLAEEDPTRVADALRERGYRVRDAQRGRVPS